MGHFPNIVRALTLAITVSIALPLNLAITVMEGVAERVALPTPMREVDDTAGFHRTNPFGVTATSGEPSATFVFNDEEEEGDDSSPLPLVALDWIRPHLDRELMTVAGVLSSVAPRGLPRMPQSLHLRC